MLGSNHWLILYNSHVHQHFVTPVGIQLYSHQSRIAPVIEIVAARMFFDENSKINNSKTIESSDTHQCLVMVLGVELSNTEQLLSEWMHMGDAIKELKAAKTASLEDAIMEERR